MKLKELPVPAPAPAENLKVREIHFHSKKVKPGDLFVAIRGNEADGHDFMTDAVQRGAIAVVGERENSGLPVPYIRVSDSRKALARMAACFYGFPSEGHTMIGVTGTNGKTTTSHMIQHILHHSGKRCSLIGTVHHQINGIEIPAANTTPDALFLQKQLAESQDTYVVMEVSSHGINQHRTDEIAFDRAIFTNLSQEHLDYHGTMEAYFQVKKKLFAQLRSSGQAVICTFSPWGRRLAAELTAAGISVTTVGETPDDTIRIQPIETGGITIREGSSVHTLSLPLPGAYNARNAAAAYGTVRTLGIPATGALRALESFPGVPGRFEVFHDPGGTRFVIDYAHTPDGLAQFLKTLRSRAKGRIFHVFGFRGDRDPCKRGELLAISSRFSDRIHLTRDKYGKMSPQEMKKEMERLAKTWGKGKVTIIEDRSLAIEKALEAAGPEDWIAITGKGPEPYDQPCTFPVQSDPEAVRWLLKREQEKV